MGAAACSQKTPPSPTSVDCVAPPNIHGSVRSIRRDEEIYFHISRLSNWRQHQVRQLHLKFLEFASCSNGSVVKLLQKSPAFHDTDTDALIEYPGVDFADDRASNVSENECISKEVFCQSFLSRQDEPEADSTLVNSLFRFFDTDGSGDIDFTEFATGLSLCCTGSIEDRLTLLFAAFDHDSDGVITPRDLYLLLSTARSGISRSQAADLEAAAERLLNEYGGIIRLQEFRSWAAPPRIDLGRFFNRFNVLPSLEEERATIRRLVEETPLNVGAYWYVIAYKWWVLWKEYVDYDLRHCRHLSASVTNLTSSKSHNLADQVQHQRQPSVYVASQRPGSIDNGQLEDSDFPGTLANKLTENYDFIVVPQSAWNILLVWYGASPAFRRRVVLTGSASKRVKRIDLYPHAVTLCLPDSAGYPNETTARTALLSCDATMSQLIDAACYKFKVSSARLRLWVTVVDAWYPIVPESMKTFRRSVTRTLEERDGQIDPSDFFNQTLQDLDFGEREVVMVEMRARESDAWTLQPPKIKSDWTNFQIKDRIDVKTQSGVWFTAEVLQVIDPNIEVHYLHFSRNNDEWIPADAICMCPVESPCRCDKRLAPLYARCQSSFRRLAKFAETRVAKSRLVSGTDANSIGLCGLQNLGNTCFLSSTLQCLSNTPILNNYFLDKRYVDDLNRKNPLGLKGKLAEEFYLLLQQIWSGRHTSIAPTGIQRAIHEFAPQFSDHMQHDAQEFLAFFLDGVHEDLNRVREKPQTVAVESYARSDSMVARESWSLHLKRNRSIIVDLFHGQLKSRIVCPSCGKESVTFDPFMYLSCPLPIPSKRALIVRLVKRSGIYPQRYGICVQKEGTVEDVLSVLSKIARVPQQSLLLSEISRQKVYRTLALNTPISQLRENDDVYAYEQDPNLLSISEKHICTIHVVHRRMDQSTLPFVSFSIPLIVVIPRTRTYSAVYRKIAQRIRAWLPNENDIDPLTLKLSMQVLNYLGTRCLFCSPLSDCRGCTITADDADSIDLPQLDESNHRDECFRDANGTLHPLLRPQMMVALSWSKEVAEIVREKGRYEYVHPSAKDAAAGLEAAESNPLTLRDALRSYTKTETLEASDAWFCDNCNEFRKASKQIELWKVPFILVIHLKRFLVSGGKREKISAFVDFPTTGLDLSSMVMCPDDELPVYDLFAVIDHIGASSGFGHYTCSALNAPHNEWFLFDDSSVTEIDEKSLKSENVYVLFYHRVR